jgi:hypothetical protein
MALSGACLAQQQQPGVAVQREAMKKLDFLVGKWSGPASVSLGPGAPIQLTQSELVQFKMDGLVLLVEGTGRDASGKIVYQALGTIAYDDAASTYRFRAYNNGHYLDTDLKVTPKGFEWGYTAGPLKVKNVMRINEKGEWAETTESAYGAAPPRKSVDMALQRQP